MSAISRKLRLAIYAKLTDASVLATGVTGVHYHRVPEDEVLPYIVFSRVAPGRVTRAAFDTNLILEDDLWQISAFADEDSSPTKAPHQVIEEILAAAETSINTGLTVTGNTVESARRDSDIPSMSELANGRWIYQEGFNLRTQVS